MKRPWDMLISSVEKIQQDTECAAGMAERAHASGGLEKLISMLEESEPA